MATAMVTPPMRRKAEALVSRIPFLSKGRSKITGDEFAIFPGSVEGTAWWANFSGCTCPGFRHRGICAHQLACDLLGEREEASRQAEAVPTLASYRDLFPGCVAGCGELVERKNQKCHRCASNEAYRLEQQAKRERAEAI